MTTVGGKLLKSAAVAGDTRMSETNCRSSQRGASRKMGRGTSSIDMPAGL